MKIFWKGIAVFGVVGALAWGQAALAFIGPAAGQAPGSGGGLFYVDANQNIGFGTSSSTPTGTFDDNETGHGHVFTVASTTNPGLALKNLDAGTTFIWSARNSGRIDLYRESSTLDGKILLSVSETGLMSVNTFPTSTARLSVGGNVQSVGGAFVGQLSGGLSAGNVTGPSAFGSNYGTYNYAFPGALAVGTSTTVGLSTGGLYVSGNVGIGTTNPSSKLEVDGNIEIGYANGLIFESNNGNNYARIDVDDGHQGYYAIVYDSWGADNSYDDMHVFQTNHDTKMVIENSGNIGIGTTSPGARLHIVGSGRQSIRLGNNNDDDVDIFFNTDGNDWTIGTDKDDSNKFKISDYSTLGTNDRITISTSGNVGVATTTPTTGRLVVSPASGVSIDAAGGRMIGLGTPTSNSDAATKSYVDSVIGGGSGTGSFATLSVSGTSTLATTAGRVGIGTTDPDYLFDVAGTANADKLIVGGTGDSGDKVQVYGGNYYISGNFGIDWDNGSAYIGKSTYDLVFKTYDGVDSLDEQLRITSAGNVGIGTTSPGAKLHVSGGSVLLENANYYAIKNTAGVIKALAYLDGSDNSYLGATGTGLGDTFIRAGDAGNVITIKNPTGNVGIGTSTPAYKLDVTGTGRYTQPVIVGTPTASGHAATKSYVDSATVGQTGWTDGGAIVYTTTASDRVGVGVESPDAKLEIRDTSINTFTDVGDQSNYHIYVTGNNTDNTAKGIGFGQGDTVGGAIILEDVGGNHLSNMHFYTKGNTDLGGDPSVQMTIDENGNVGIGTTSPNGELHVKSSGVADLIIDGGATSEDALRFYDNGVESWILRQTNDDNYLRFRYGGMDRVTLKSDGNVGIGTTDPGARLEVNATTDRNTIFRRNSTGQEWALNLDNDNFIIEDVTHDSTAVTILDGASPLVGIGTPPTYKLDVVGTGRYTQPVIVGTPTGDTHAATKSYVDSATVGQTGWTDGGTSVYLTTTGDSVGIGTTSPTQKLEVAGDMKVAGNFLFGNLATIPATHTDTNYNFLWFPNAASIGGDDSSLWANISLRSNWARNLGGNPWWVYATDGPAWNLTMGHGPNLDSFTIERSPTGIAGQDLIAGINTFFKINSSGNVGIGTTSPSARLHIGDSLPPDLTAGDPGSLYITNAGTASTHYVFQTKTNGGQFIIRNDGNVGIGTSTPAYKLDITGTGRYTQPVVVGTPTASGHAATKSYVDSATVGQTGWTDGGTSVYTTTAGDNVGIGTTNPGVKVDIQAANGDVEGRVYQISGNALAKLSVLSGATWSMAANPITGTNAYGFEIQKSGAAKLVIDTNGNVGIGTTSPESELEINRASETDHAQITLDAGIAKDTSIRYKENDTQKWWVGYDAGDDFFEFYDYSGTPGTRMVIEDGTGNVGIGTTSPTALLHLGEGDIKLTQAGSGTSRLIDAGTTRIDLGNDSNQAITMSADGGMRFDVDTNNNETGSSFTFTTNDNGTTLMKIQDNGNVGIGTTSPSYKLDVTGTGRYTQPVVVGTPTASGHAATKSYVDSATVGQTGWTDGGTSVYTTTLTDSVGIGTTTPQEKLHVQGNLVLSSGSQDIGWANNEVLQIGQWNADYTVYSERMRIDTSGNVGIGTTSPGRELEVYSSIPTIAIVSSDNTSYSHLAFGDPEDDNQAQILYDHNVDKLSLQTGGGTTFGGGKDRIVIDTDGNVGIGTTNPQVSLEINNTSPRIRLQDTDGVQGYAQIEGNNAGSLLLGADVGNVGTGDIISFSINNDEKARIQSNGNVGIGTTSPGAKLQVQGYTGAASDGPQYVYGKTSIFANIGETSLFLGAKDTSYANRGYGFVLSQLGVNTNLNIVEHGTGGTRMTFQSGGNVGIGTSTPAYKLDITGTGRYTQPVVVGTPTGNTHAATKSYVDSATVGQTGWTDGGSSVYTTTLTDKVGIGTSTPATSLHVSGGNILIDNEGEIRTLDNTGTQRTMMRMVGGTNVLEIWNSAGNIAFQGGNNVGIGTTSPGAKLDVQGNIFSSGSLLQNGMGYTQGTSNFGSGSSGHYYNLLVGNHSGTYDEYEIWGTVVVRESGNAKVAYMPFVLTVKQQGLVSTTEPTIGFKYWKDGDTNARLLVKRTSSGGATTKTIKLWLYTPTGYATANWEYHYSNNYWTINQSPTDEGTSEPSGTSPDYYGNELLAVDGGNVGIGTTSPQGTLHLEGGAPRLLLFDSDTTIGAANPAFSIRAFNDGYFKIQSTENYSDYTDIFTIKSGNVGIGTSTPAYKLDVTGTGRYTQPVIVGTPTASGHAATKSYVDSATVGQTGWTDGGTSVYTTTLTDSVGIGTTSPTNPQSWGRILQVSNSGTNGGAISVADANGEWNIASYQNKLRIANAGSSPAMVILSSGNVGIGTTSPEQKLDVKGSVILDSDRSYYWRDSEGNADRWIWGDSSDSSIKFGTNNNVRLTIQDGGNVGIGTSTPAYKLDITGTGRYTQPVVVGTPTASGHAATKSYVDSATVGQTGWTDGGSSVYLTTTADNVGIGDSTPSYGKLTVSDSSSLTPVLLSLENNYDGPTSQSGSSIMFSRSGSTGSNWALITGSQQNASNYNYGRLDFGTRTSDALGIETKLSILANGNIGIGTTSPGAPLHVYETTSANPQFIIENTATYRAAKFGFYTGSASGFGTADYSLSIVNMGSNGDIAFRAANSGDVQMIVKPSGNVGIGTTNPQAALEVQGDVIVEL